MNHKTTSLLALLFFIYSHSFSQTFIKRLTINFATGKYKLTKKNRKVIFDFFEALPQDDSTRMVIIRQITIDGNTDNEGDSLTNITLSENRTESVSKYLIGQGFNNSIIKKTYNGQNRPIASNKDSLSRSKNRRVDIIVRYSVIKEQPEPTAKTSLANKKPDPCKDDTAIVMNDGAKFVINICQYHKFKSCMHIEQLKTRDEMDSLHFADLPDSLKSNGVVTGWKFRFCGDTCMDKPIRLLYPVNPCIKDPEKHPIETYKWYNGRWHGPIKNAVKIVTIHSLKYYEFKVACSCEMYHILCGFSFKPKKKIFKAKDGLKLLKVSLERDCPHSIWQGAINKRQTKAIFKMSCPWDELNVYVKAVDKNGDTLVMNYRPVNDIKKRKMFCNCGTSEKFQKKFLWVFPVYMKTLYKKYFIELKDFEHVPTQYPGLN